MTHAGELLGLLVVARAAGAAPLTDADGDAAPGPRAPDRPRAAQRAPRLGAARRRWTSSRPRPTSCAPRGRAWCARPTPSAGGSSATCTTAPSAVVRLGPQPAARARAGGLRPRTRPRRAHATRRRRRARVGAFRDLARGIYPPRARQPRPGRGPAHRPRARAVGARLDVTGGGATAPTSRPRCTSAAWRRSRTRAGTRAQTRASTVRVWEEDGGLHFEVVDDGAGVRPGRPRHRRRPGQHRRPARRARRAPGAALGARAGHDGRAARSRFTPPLRPRPGRAGPP